MEKIQKIASEFNIQIIICYHPRMEIQKDGTLIFSSSEKLLNEWKTSCEKNELIFVDLTETFSEKYEENYTLPYGFSNSKVGEGHLNRYGHQEIAKELAEEIRRLEQQ